MNKNHTNIEDYVASKLKDLEMKPSSNLWNTIDKDMATIRFEKKCKTSLKGFKITPSYNVWRKIAVVLWFKSILKVVPLSFNVYYLGSIILLLGFVLINDNKFNDNKNEYYNSNFLKDIQVVEPAQIENEEILAMLANDDVLNESNNKLSNNNAVSISSKTQNPKTNIYANSLRQSVKQNNAATISNNIEIQDQTVQSVTTSNSFIFNNKLTYSKLHSNNLFSLNNYYLHDSILSQNPLFYKSDTIAYNYLGKPIIIKPHLEFNIYYTPYFIDYSNKLKTNELSQNFNFYNEHLEPLLTYSLGFSVSYHKNNYRYEAGFAYNRLNEGILAVISNTNVEMWHYDTITLIDPVLNLPVIHVDSVLTHIEDSLPIHRIDTITTTTDIMNFASYHRVEMPLIVGYELLYRRFAISANLGTVIVFLVNRTGTDFDITDGRIKSAASFPNNTVMFDYYASFRLKYIYHRNKSVFVEPHFRGNLYSLYKSDYVFSKRNNQFGVRLGLSFAF